MKIMRNAVYAACGYTILACLALMVVVTLMPNPMIQALNPIFWLESTSIVAFGVSWFVKGEAILKD